MAEFAKRMQERADALEALHQIDPALADFLRERAGWFLDGKNMSEWIKLMRKKHSELGYI